MTTITMGVQTISSEDLLQGKSTSYLDQCNGIPLRAIIVLNTAMAVVAA
ncbi:hypothetical protein [Spartinivicinus poritis]|nr:hypothetical protein [Spartinivicinus sp. A2-2]